ncbi:MAG: glycine dehydrogenase (aminomethyl-transferring), partial [Candidatus Dadabacteria bacterium]
MDFYRRHIGPNEAELESMLKEVGYSHLDEMIAATVPEDILQPNSFEGLKPAREREALAELRKLSLSNKVKRSFIGLGYYETVMPEVIKRCIWENPCWYTQYTPYQAEISQGRLEALLVFQTMVSDLTALPVANASLLDEGTACAEAAMMALRISKGKARKVLVSSGVFPQTLSVLRTRIGNLGVELVEAKDVEGKIEEGVAAVIMQYPDLFGSIADLSGLADKIHSAGGLLIVCADLLGLCLLKPPGEMGADIAVGSTQRFGLPFGYGGPHAGYISCRDELKRQLP